MSCVSDGNCTAVGAGDDTNSSQITCDANSQNCTTTNTYASQPLHAVHTNGPYQRHMGHGEGAPRSRRGGGTFLGVSCTGAPAGEYVASVGATAATPCAAGSYQPDTGQTSCILAEVGFYVPSSGQVSEIACAPLKTTVAPGATSCESELGALLTDVTGVGPGRSLADKVTSLEAFVSANDVPDACSTLGGFIHEVNAQAGKKIANAQAASFISRAQGIEAVLGCSAG